LLLLSAIKSGFLEEKEKEVKVKRREKELKRRSIEVKICFKNPFLKEKFLRRIQLLKLSSKI